MTTTTAASVTRTPRWGVWVAIAAVVVVLGGSVLTGWLAGYRWFDVTTPSMGTSAPVGTLLVTKPVDVADVEVGDLVVHRNPTGHLYSHRVVATSGTVLTTKGDINGSVDPWAVTQNSVVGVSVATVKNAGWVLRGAPWLIGGLVLVETALATLVPARFRSRGRFLLDVLVVDVTAWIIKPFTGAVALAYRATTGGMEVTAVSTGILPIRVSGAGGTHTDLLQGHVGSAAALTANDDGRYVFTPTLHMSWVWWVGCIAVCLLPLVYSLLVGFADTDDEEPQDRHRPRGRRVVVPVALAAAFAAMLGTVTDQAHGTYTASITNTANSAGYGSRTFFTCLDAMQYFNQSTVNGKLLTGFTFGNGTGVTGTTDQGAYGFGPLVVSNLTTTSDVGCASDDRARSQRAITLNGTSSRVDVPDAGTYNSTATDPRNSNNLTWSLWFKTTTTRGGILVCSGDRTFVCTDRSTWLTNTGRVAFQVGSTQLLSTNALNDGIWHHVVTQLSSTTGMKMWIDGTLDKTNAWVTSGSNGTQWPQWGYSASTLNKSYANRPTSVYFAGSMQMGAIIGRSSGRQVGDAEVLAMYQAAA